MAGERLGSWMVLRIRLPENERMDGQMGVQVL